MKMTHFLLLLAVSLSMLQAQQVQSDTLLWLHTASADTLQVQHPELLRIETAPRQTIPWTRQQTIGIWTMAAFGILAWYLDNEADRAYDDYLHSGSIADMDRLFQKAQQLDRLTGWAYAGAELGFLFTVFSFDKKPK